MTEYCVSAARIWRSSPPSTLSCAKGYFSFDQPERSQSVDPNEDNNQNQSKTFKECQNIIWKSEHRNDQKSEYKWQNSLQSLCADQNQNRVRMFEIFQGGLSQSPAAKPSTVTIRLIKTPMTRATGNFHSQPGWLNQVEIVDPSSKSLIRIRIKSNDRREKYQAGDDQIE